MADKKIKKTDREWKESLSADQFCILRQKGTEHAFTGKYVNEKSPGKYVCAGCGLELFDSDAKYDSGSGWPSFFAPLNSDNIETQTDESIGVRRVEVHCKQCGGHLGHVFDDGPQPTGMRYCINSASIRLVKREK